MNFNINKARIELSKYLDKKIIPYETHLEQIIYLLAKKVQKLEKLIKKHDHPRH